MVQLATPFSLLGESVAKPSAMGNGATTTAARTWRISSCMSAFRHTEPSRSPKGPTESTSLGYGICVFFVLFFGPAEG